MKTPRQGPPPRCAECGREYLLIPELTRAGLCLLCTLARAQGADQKDVVEVEK